MFLFVCWLFHLLFFKPVSGETVQIGSCFDVHTLYHHSDVQYIWIAMKLWLLIPFDWNLIWLSFFFKTTKRGDYTFFVSSSLLSKMLCLVTWSPRDFSLLLLHNYTVTMFGVHNLAHKDLDIFVVQTCQLRKQPAAAVVALHAYKCSQNRFRIIQSDWF